MFIGIRYLHYHLIVNHGSTHVNMERVIIYKGRALISQSPISTLPLLHVAQAENKLILILEIVAPD